MFEFTSLKVLHDDMKGKAENRATFPFTFNGKDFGCIFIADIYPMRLYLTTLGSNPIVFEFEIDDRYCTKSSMDKKSYKNLVAYLELKYDPNHVFKPNDFLESLNNKIPKIFNKRPSYSDVTRIASKIRKLEEANKIYFCGWKRNGVGQRVQEPNIEKTRSAFGDEMAKMCEQKNISSCWTANVNEEAIRRLNELYSM